jgi:hypothetical protein
MGGITTNQAPQLNCCGYDTVKQIWFKMRPIDKPRYNTSAVVIDNQAIYLMPGASAKQEREGGMTIFQLHLKGAN